MRIATVFGLFTLVGSIWSSPAYSQVGRSALSGLQPGDVVRLQIWREPDLSGDFPVDQRGVVTFPKLGPVSVAEENAQSLKSRLVSAYQEYLRNPSIEVTLLRRINVLGAVKSPGLYPVDPSMTIADAVALAGGATPDGNRREIELMRGGERIAVRLTDAVRIADLPLQSGDQLFVPERSWISRNPGLLATSISAGVSLIIAVFIR
jgi:protein involved in polysaccharide export with SLBB domain